MYLFKNTKKSNFPNRCFESRFSVKKSLVSIIQSKYKEQENFVFSVYLLFKACLSLLAMVSLLKIGYTSKVRLTRLQEIKDSYSYEKSRFESLSDRFDDLLSIEGEQRFMKDQDQMISRDIIRVIWR